MEMMSALTSAILLAVSSYRDGPSEAPYFGRWKQKKAWSWMRLNHLVQDKICGRKAATITLVK